MKFTDTSPDAERVQIKLLREAGRPRRFEIMCSLTHFINQLSRRAIARRNPEMASEERNLLFLSLNYGPELSERVKRYQQIAKHG